MSFTDTLGESEYVGQYAIKTLGFVVHKAGVPADADADAVTVTMDTPDGSRVLFAVPADHPATGTYEVTLSSADTSTPGMYRLTWVYAIDGVAQSFVGLVEVGESSAAYDRLPEAMQGVVESAWIRFADLFDSPAGGPNLQTYFQTRFGRGRMAQLLQIALGRLNTIAQPYTTYTLDGQGGAAFPIGQWGGLLDQALYIEALKHLIRSYVEQPEAVGVTVARMDRRDYMNRWQAVLDMEQQDFRQQLEVFKIRHMGFGSPRVLVSGGVFGSYAPTRMAGSAAARPRMWSRFYAVSPGALFVLGECLRYLLR